ncbi:MAG: hypothetical protein IPK82_06975 [Polyangiaceae bacterium]|nr:hypothetical protein [Polyangiaceae bacterium]
MKAFLQVTLVSDTCFSKGLSGRSGDVNTEVEHDSNTGLPVVRGRTVKGLLVEELGLILKALETANDGVLHAQAKRLFGEPGDDQAGTLRIGDGHLPSDLVEKVLTQSGRTGDLLWTRANVLDALTTVRRQTKVNSETGAPEEGSFRSTRLLRAGISFYHPITFLADPSPHALALLSAAALAVRRAGVHRNRGWGQVRVRVLNENGSDTTVEWAAPLWNHGFLTPTQNPSPVDTATKVVGPTAKEPLATSDDEKRSPMVVTYRLRLAAPVLLGLEPSDPGTIETLFYVTGSSVLGALAGRFLTQVKSDATQSDMAVDPTFRALFLDSQTRWLNAYPSDGQWTRLLPAPRSWRIPKYSTSAVVDLVGVHNDGEVDNRDQLGSAPSNDRFVKYELNGDSLEIAYRKISREARIHNERDPEAGRSTDNKGTVFSYIALPAGECFVGHVLCETESIARRVESLLKAGPLQLGRSRTTMYGGNAVVENVKMTSGNTLQEAPPTEEENEHTIVTLLSDYLGRNDRGQADPAALERELQTVLALPEPPVEKYISTRPVSGYVSKWRMPRPRQIAVTAGSVLAFRGRPSAAVISQAIWKGIGERRAEGFGRFAVNWQTDAKKIVKSNNVSGPDTHLIPIQTTGFHAAEPSHELRLVESRLLLNSARRAVIQHAIRRSEAMSGAPSPSLTARLRSGIRAATTIAQMRDFVNDLVNAKTARKVLQSVWLDNSQTLADWLMRLLSDETSFENWQQMLSIGVHPPLVGVKLTVLESERELLTRLWIDTYCEELRRRAQVSQKQPRSTAESSKARSE